MKKRRNYIYKKLILINQNYSLLKFHYNMEVLNIIKIMKQTMIWKIILMIIHLDIYIFYINYFYILKYFLII